MSVVKTFLDNKKIGVEQKHKLFSFLIKNKERLPFNQIYDLVFKGEGAVKSLGHSNLPMFLYP